MSGSSSSLSTPPLFVKHIFCLFQSATHKCLAMPNSHFPPTHNNVLDFPAFPFMISGKDYFGFTDFPFLRSVRFLSCKCWCLLRMPRPGGRPYECIRRAWHGDDHLTLRGTLIQEIFRIVNEIHSPTTRKKKEWQEKLPMVVLRAEDILYSKANSEAEYMDLKTLRSRLNDSINTMIRRDVSTEGGQYLEPCVEAALSLGCLPKKGSRTQRHSSHSSEGSNQKPTMASSTPAMGKSNNHRSYCSEDKSRLQRNGVYNLCAITPPYHFLDSQHYILTPIPAPLVLCSPSTGVVNVPSTIGSHLFSPTPHNTSYIETLLNFNQQSTPPICMPLCCPQHSTTITRGIPSSYMMNVASIAPISSGEGTSISATSGPCFVHPDFDSQNQAPHFSSQTRCLPQTGPLTLNEQHKPNMHPPSRHLQTVRGHTPTEGMCSAQGVNNIHDLQLRLGPPGNSHP